MAAESPRRRAAPRLKRPGVNPILIKELRSRMRGPRAFLLLTAFLLLLSGVTFLLYKAMESALSYGTPLSMSAMIGVALFQGLALFALFVVVFVTPALTAGTISGEREALTYEMLVATPLSPSAILVGKMVAALSYIFLLIFAAVPLFSLVFIFGGIVLQDLAEALLFLGITTLCFGTIGLFWSALTGRTGRATVLSYLTVLSLIIAPYIAYFAWGILKQQMPPPILLFPNPFTAMNSVATMGPNGGVGIPFFGGVLGGGGGLPIAYAHPTWHWTAMIYLLLTVVLGLATVLLVRPIGQRRITLPQALLATLLIAAVIGGSALLFDAADLRQVTTSPDILLNDPRGGPNGPPPAMVEPLINP